MRNNAMRWMHFDLFKAAKNHQDKMRQNGVNISLSESQRQLGIFFQKVNTTKPIRRSKKREFEFKFQL